MSMSGINIEFIPFLLTLDNNKFYILKYNYGANGWAQIKFKPKELINYINDKYIVGDNVIDKSIKKINDENIEEDKYNVIDVESEKKNIKIKKTMSNYLSEFHTEKNKSHWDLLFNNSGCNTMIQEYIPDIVSEYRVIIFYNNIENPMIIKRTIDKTNGNWQANSSTTGGVNNIIYDCDMEFVYSDIPLVYDWILKYSNIFLTIQDTPMVSLDLYVTKDNEIGCFEFSNEMGLAYTNIEIVIKRFNNALIDKINDTIHNGRN